MIWALKTVSSRYIAPRYIVHSDIVIFFHVSQKIISNLAKHFIYFIIFFLLSVTTNAIIFHEVYCENCNVNAN